jgi:hypothetical protein
LGLLSGKCLKGFQRIPAPECRRQSPAVAQFRSAARVCGFKGGRRRGAALGPPQSSEEGGFAPCQGEGSQHSLPLPTRQPWVKCSRCVGSLQLPGSPHLGRAAHAVTWSNCPGGSARRLRSAAAPPSCPAGSGESKGLGALRGLQGAPPGDRI